jgi:hypothetical protein
LVVASRMNTRRFELFRRLQPPRTPLVACVCVPIAW